MNEKMKDKIREGKYIHEDEVKRRLEQSRKLLKAHYEYRIASEKLALLEEMRMKKPSNLVKDTISPVLYAGYCKAVNEFNAHVEKLKESLHE